MKPDPLPKGPWMWWAKSPPILRLLTHYHLIITTSSAGGQASPRTSGSQGIRKKKLSRVLSTITWKDIMAGSWSQESGIQGRLPFAKGLSKNIVEGKGGSAGGSSTR